MVRILLALQLSLCFPFAAGAEDVGADAVAADLASADTAAADAKGPVLHQVTKRDGGYELAPGPNVEGVVFLRQVYPKEETWPEPVIEAFHQVPWIDAASVRVRWANLEPNDQEFRWQAFDRILAEVRKYNRLHPESPRTMHIRAMGGEHVPDWFEWAGVKMYDTLDPLRSGGKLRYRQIRIPVPYDNPEYLKQLRQLYVAMRERYGQEPLVTVFHGTWSAGPWDEIFHPQNDAPLPADYSPERFVQGMVEQLDVLIDEICAAGEVAELPYSGKYPSKTQIDITGPLTRRIVERLGRRSPFFYVQSNGWGVTGDGTPTVSWGHQRDVDDAVGQVNLALQAIGTNAGGGWHVQGDWIDAVTIAKRYEAAYLEVYYADFMPLDEKNHITAAFNHAAVSRPGTGSTSPSGPRD
ncbi:MAG: beta-galactosidase, partial [Planctomycetota bacterium]